MRVTAALTLLVAAGGCSVRDSRVATLYRNSAAPGGEAARIHIATFDANDSWDYNIQNCAIARDLFQDQPGVKTRFWCEKGRFRE